MRIQAKWDGRGPRSQRGDNTTAWEKLLPTFGFSFRADSTVSLPRSPCSLLSMLAVASLFFPFLFFFFFFFFSFFPFPLNPSASTSPPPSPSLCLVHPKKPPISHFPPFPPSSLTVQDTSPRAHAGRPFAVAVATTATTSRPLQPAPPHQSHRPTTGVTRLCHTDRGCKRCTGPHHFRD